LTPPEEQPAPSPEAMAPTPRELENAPIPGWESGQIVRESPEPSVGRDVARGALLLPRVVVNVALLPINGIVYLYDRYDLENVYYNTFYNRDRTFGIVPTLVYATGFGPMFGGRLIWKDVFGANENLVIEAAYGGTYQARAAGWFNTGTRFDGFVVGAGANFDRFARLPFYGIGNIDDRSPPPPPDMLIDPLVNPTAVKTFYRYQEIRGGAALDYRIVDALHFVGRGEYADLHFEGSTSDPSIQTVYNPMDLIGFENGVRHLYGEVALRWDTRRTAHSPWEVSPYTTGYLVSGFVGGVSGLNNTGSFGHYGIDLQYFLHLALGPRMLAFRIFGEGVTGNLDDVPFAELPYLGGDILRGYNFARFRDRVSGVGTVEYTWDISRFANAFLFMDAGRVYGSISDITLDNMRIGFGGGLELFSTSSYVVRGTLASSKDGGVFFTAALNPLWNEVPRWR
jgi:hypothetical protein